MKLLDGISPRAAVQLALLGGYSRLTPVALTLASMATSSTLTLDGMAS